MVEEEDLEALAAVVTGAPTATFCFGIVVIVAAVPATSTTPRPVSPLLPAGKVAILVSADRDAAAVVSVAVVVGVAVVGFLLAMIAVFAAGIFANFGTIVDPPCIDCFPASVWAAAVGNDATFAATFFPNPEVNSSLPPRSRAIAFTVAAANLSNSPPLPRFSADASIDSAVAAG